MSKKLLANVGNTVVDNYRRYYQEYEGTFITATDKSEDDTLDTSRYIEVTEIWGNTIQDEENLEDIQSIGELYVDEQGQPILDDLGREQYKIEIESCNKNLYDGKFFECFYKVNSNGISKVVEEGIDCIKVEAYNKYQGKGGYFINFKPNKTYTFSCNLKTTSSRGCIIVRYTDDTVSYTTGFVQNEFSKVTLITKTNKTVKCIEVAWLSMNDYVFIDESSIQLEEGTVATEYTSPLSHKTTILLPCQLQKVGNVYDRLYWDSEKGRYVVEKNICKRVIDGDYTWGATPSYYYIASFFKEKPKSTIFIESQDMKCVNLGTLNLYIPLSKFTSKDECKNHFSSNNMSLYYQLITPQLIETNITEKILLPCYEEKTHIFVNDSVDATMKVLVPYKEII